VAGSEGGGPDGGREPNINISITRRAAGRALCPRERQRHFTERTRWQGCGILSIITVSQPASVR